MARAKDKCDSFELIVDIVKSSSRPKTHLADTEQQRAILAKVYADAKNRLVDVTSQYEIIVNKYFQQDKDADRAVIEACSNHENWFNEHKSYYEEAQATSFYPNNPREFVEEFFLLGSTLVLFIGVFYGICHFFIEFKNKNKYIYLFYTFFD